MLTIVMCRVAIEQSLPRERAPNFTGTTFGMLHNSQGLERRMRATEMLEDFSGLSGVRDNQIETTLMELAESDRLRGIQGFEQIVTGRFEEVVQLRPNGTARIDQKDRRRDSRTLPCGGQHPPIAPRRH